MPLRKRTVRPMQEFRGGVLVVHGKHGDTYYHVPTEAHLHVAALDILQMHKQAGYYAYLECAGQETEWSPKHPGMEPEEIEKLPAGAIRDTARKEWQAWVKHQAAVEGQQRDWKFIERALREKDGYAAWTVLQERRDAEYERVTIEWLSGEDLELLPRPKKPRHGQRWTDPEGQRWIFDGEEGRNLGWIKGNHAQWEAIYAAHETGDLKPEIEDYETHDIVHSAWRVIYHAHKEGQTTGLAAEEVRAHPEDFKSAIEELVQFSDHPRQSMKLVTDPGEALAKGEAILTSRERYGTVTCRLVADPAIESLAEQEARYERKRAARKKRKTG